jgi:hypothetical protein
MVKTFESAINDRYFERAKVVETLEPNGKGKKWFR